MTTTAPIDGIAPVWVHHHAHLPARRMDRPRSARVAASDDLRARLERIAMSESPGAGASITSVERHIVDCMRHEAVGRHMAPVTDSVVTRAWVDFQALIAVTP